MSKRPVKKKNLLKLLLLGMVAIGVVAIFRFTSLDVSDFTPTNVKKFILGFGIYAPAVFLTIYTLRSVLLFMPVFVVSLASGLTFGPLWGWLLNVTGATMGACASFFVARYFGAGFLAMIPGLQSGSFDKFSDKIAAKGFLVVLPMRLVGIPPFDVLNYGCGLSKVKFRDYVAASFLGMLPGGFFTTYLGSSLENPLSLKFVVALVAFILLMFVPAVYKKFRKAKEE